MKFIISSKLNRHFKFQENSNKQFEKCWVNFDINLLKFWGILHNRFEKF